MELNFTLNGVPISCSLPRGSELLLDVLRGPLEQTGTKEGCGKGECGACTILVEGRMVNACLTLAAEVEGCEVTTIEGLAAGGSELAAEQRAFVEQGGIQCGFCSPGMIMSVRALLDRDPDPPEAEIRRALAGNLCRCTGYSQIVEAVRRAAELRREEAR
ncbi:MAG: 4-hydroxybenzoyl-CoA reductase subunit gamma [Gemmatimonadetes bacterium]|nr:4-hydroxybenzoyl-CoA reductase subunit gamma [Gemmatimonadota bacterium]